MAEKQYNLKLQMSDGTEQNAQFSVPALTDENNAASFGDKTIASGQYSIAAGSHEAQFTRDPFSEEILNLNPTEAAGDMSFAFGAGVTAHTKWSEAIGMSSSAGVKGYYWSNIDFTLNTITLSTQQFKAVPPTTLDWEVGDIITIYNRDKYPSCSTITAINLADMIIEVDALPFSTNGYLDPEYTEYFQDDMSIYVPAKPRAGEVEFAWGAYSHGLHNHTTGAFSTTFGFNNQNEGEFSLVAGSTNIANAKQSLVVGKQNEVYGYRGTALGWQNKTYSRQGHVEGRNNIVGDPINLTSDAIFGENSHAEGGYNTVTGIYAHAEGKSNTISGDYAHVEGFTNTVTGERAHAEGCNNTASGYASHAEGGSYNVASGKAAHAEGFRTTASGENSHTEGESTEASNERAHAEGYATKATGINSHAEGDNTTASSEDAHAEGHYTTASGKYSHAEGFKTLASKATAHAEGKETQAIANYSHAEGQNAVASGASSHAEGKSTAANGEASHAEGGSTTAVALYSHAEGFETSAKGVGSHAEGCGTIAKRTASHASGQYNIADESHLVVVGNGTSDTARSNAYTLNDAGDAWYAGSITATKLILGPESYGTTLPENGVEGQIFFLIGGKTTGSVEATDDGNGIITLG